MTHERPGRRRREEENNDTDFGDRLTQYRERKRITQKKLATESKVPEETISRMKKGERVTAPVARIHLRSRS